MTEKFDSDFGLLSNTSNDIFPNDMFDGETGGNDVQPDDVIIIYMDIREPLSKLKTLLEQKVGIALKKYRFWLQDAQMLEPHKNLVDQCVEGEGIVQINVQLQAINRRINIVDVLKPTEESLEFLANELSLPDTKPFNDLKMDDNRNNNTDSSDDVGNEDDDDASKGGGHARDRDDDDNSNDIVKNIFNDDELTPKWILDNNCKFKKDQARLNIPDDPSEWNTSQVQHWLQWAVREFHMTQIKFSDWLLTGKQLCEMPLTEFDKIVPYDPGNIFRTHFELLRKCKFVAVLQNRKTLDLKIFGAENNTKPVRVMKKMPKKVTTSINDDKHYMLSDNRNPTGQIQLWQFLLDLLTDHEYRSIIHWITPDGEFRLADPEQVAKLWGIRKNKPSMNYEKLSRALRYYYDGDMISKVHGKRFVYKFVCNLKQLIGYDARELARLIAHCAMMKKKEKADKNTHNI